MNENLITLLNEINTLRAYDVYIPSLKKTVKFKPLIIEQFQNFIDRVSNNPYFNVGFQQELTNIIENNIIDKSISVHDLTEIDKLAIAITVRINDISSIYDGKSIEFLKDSITSVIHPEPKNIISNNITIFCRVPNLLTELHYNSYAETNLNKTVEDTTALKEIINLMFITEIAKCVYKLTIDNIEYIQSRDFNEWVNTIAALPTNILMNAIEYTDNIKSVKDNMLKIDASTSIDYDLRIFTAS